MFSKIGQKASRLFQKANQTIPPMFRKIDNSLQRVSSFAQPVLKQFGYGGIADAIGAAQRGLHNTRTTINNNLERAIKTPVNDLRRNFA
jgi:hypothetical protein